MEKRFLHDVARPDFVVNQKAPSASAEVGGGGAHDEGVKWHGDP